MLLSRSQLHRHLLAWYRKNKRPLPWRSSTGHQVSPYHVLVSEAMLQQTQVATVLPYFDAFICRFVTLEDLAAADEQQVLKLWQGLGYYSRARNLLAAAKQIVAEHNGQIPRDVESLLRLPGIGRYTAGAIASLAYNVIAPILDGNVARVLIRLDGIRSSVHDPETRKRLWVRAEEILPAKHCGDFNSALMELGATICTPKNPKCLVCPMQAGCEAFAQGIQEQIPLPRKSRAVPLVRRRTFCIRRPNRKWLIEQRPANGRWANLWQFVTAESEESPVTAKTVLAATGVKADVPKHLAVIEHSLTHRRYRFDVYLCDVRGPVGKYRAPGRPRRWVRLDELSAYPLSRPQLQIANLLARL
ncbi:MAG TPA: A/G-specific adenine glycosylase [Tepidisphaeraceae bacterium]|nr:A/G-specific adenine glycosylase [Tepidisphaeraceae bacterium]